MKARLKLETLHQIRGGDFAIAVDQEIERVTQDCMNRGADPSARKVTIELEFKPEANANGVCEGIDLVAKCKAKLPDRKTAIVPTKPRPNGELLFTLEGDHPDQMRLGDIDTETGEVRGEGGQ